MATTFIGVDLAWKVDGNHSGCAVLESDGDRARLVTLSDDVRSLAALVRFIERHATANTVVAVDGPLAVSNETGQRPCETAIGRRFGRFGASCHSNNLARTPRPAGVRLVAALRERGFRHDFALPRAAAQSGRWLLEVYPHPAIVVLFGLAQIIRYKKGPVAERRTELARYQRLLLGLCNGGGLVATTELERLCATDPAMLAGHALKEHEDRLDGAFCGYLAFHCWRWGDERNEMIGTLDAGYIVVPTQPAPVGTVATSRLQSRTGS